MDAIFTLTHCRIYRVYYSIFRRFPEAGLCAHTLMLGFFLDADSRRLGPVLFARAEHSSIDYMHEAAAGRGAPRVSYAS